MQSVMECRQDPITFAGNKKDKKAWDSFIYNDLAASLMLADWYFNTNSVFFQNSKNGNHPR